MPYSKPKENPFDTRYDIAMSKRPRYLSLIFANLLGSCAFYIFAVDSNAGDLGLLFLIFMFFSSLFFMYFLLGLERTSMAFGCSIIFIIIMSKINFQITAIAFSIFSLSWIGSLPILFFMGLFAYREKSLIEIPIFFISIVIVTISIDLKTRLAISNARPQQAHCMFQRSINEDNKHVGKIITSIWGLELFPISKHTKRTMLLTNHTLYIWKYTAQVFVPDTTNFKTLYFKEGSELTKCKFSLLSSENKSAK